MQLTFALCFLGALSNFTFVIPMHHKSDDPGLQLTIIHVAAKTKQEVEQEAPKVPLAITITPLQTDLETARTKVTPKSKSKKTPQKATLSKQFNNAKTIGNVKQRIEDDQRYCCLSILISTAFIAATFCGFYFGFKPLPDTPLPGSTINANTTIGNSTSHVLIPDALNIRPNINSCNSTHACSDMRQALQLKNTYKPEQHMNSKFMKRSNNRSRGSKGR